MTPYFAVNRICRRKFGRPVTLNVDACFDQLSCQISMHDELAAMVKVCSMSALNAMTRG